MTKVWQTQETGEWIVSYPGGAARFASQGEAEIMAQKVETAKAIVAAVKSLATAADGAADLVAEYFDAGAFIDGDLVPLGITADTLAACITLLQQVDLLMTNGTPSPAMYRSTLNKVRRVAV